MSPKPRPVLIAGNWKMNHGKEDTVTYFAELKQRWERDLDIATRSLFTEGRLALCLFPPMLSLRSALYECGDLPVQIGSQNAHWEKSGAFTGEVSGAMLQEAGIETVLVGHSERRQLFGETDETVRKRAESLLAQGLKVILCIGETRAERESNQTSVVLTRQLKGALPEKGKGAAAYLDGRLVIAYEPVWAIGTGLTATPEQAEEAHQMIRKHLWDEFGMEAAGRTQILYGGSVTPENSAGLLAKPNLDGALVGGASLKPANFLAIALAGAKACS